jgi:integrase
MLRHLLRIARRWGYVDVAPEVDLPKKPEGRMRYLEEPEIPKLLDACAKSRDPYPKTNVVLELNTGMRRGEILGLTWSTSIWRVPGSPSTRPRAASRGAYR